MRFCTSSKLKPVKAEVKREVTHSLLASLPWGRFMIVRLVSASWARCKYTVFPSGCRISTMERRVAGNSSMEVLTQSLRLSFNRRLPEAVHVAASPARRT